MRRITAGLLIACLPFAASSHHSVKAFYDDQNVTQLEGNIASIRWINPHIHFEVERINDSGETEVWDVESGSVNFLERDGVSRDDMTVGTRVTVTGYSSRHGNHTMVASYVTLENGEDIVLWPGLFGGGTAAGLGGRRAPAVSDAVDDGSRSVFRVWSVGPDSAGRDGAVLELPLRPAALAAQAEYDPLTDDTALSCIQQGMPGIMDNPFPMEMVDRGTEILIRTEEWDVERTVYMNAGSAAANQTATPHGYSVGRWEGDTLVIETTNVDWPYFDDVGTPMSSEVEILERYFLSDDGQRLNMEMTVTDPLTFTEPVNLAGAYWINVPGEQIKPYECVM
jgi:hypothetical protein